MKFYRIVCWSKARGRREFYRYGRTVSGVVRQVAGEDLAGYTEITIEEDLDGVYEARNKLMGGK